VRKVSNCTHHFIIDSENVGRCKYCPAVRDFGRLLQREGVFTAAGWRGAKARLETLGKKRGRSVAAKKNWQDPEYRARQRAAHASLPGRHHKKEEALI